MEDALVPCSMFLKTKVVLSVLILVLMEDALVRFENFKQAEELAES